jgi:hypothetical protein
MKYLLNDSGHEADCQDFLNYDGLERKPDSQRSTVELQSLFQLQTFVNQRH